MEMAGTRRMHAGIRRFHGIPLGLVILLALVARSAVARDVSTQEVIRNSVEQIRSSETLLIDDARIASVTVLPELYERRNFRLAWTNPANVEALLSAIRTIDEDGLDPADYHLPQLERLRATIRAASSPDPALLADLDILLTDSLVRLAYHLLFGKVDPESLHAHWNLAREVRTRDPVQAIQDAIDAPSLGAVIEGLRPAHTFYSRLRSALARYRAIRATGGWKPVPEGPALKTGMTGARVVSLRRRLAATDDISDAALDPGTFDDGLERAVVAFQNRHRLAADGVVGTGTLAALNVPIEERIDQIRVNLERARWVFHEIADTDRLVIVDIAGFEVFYFGTGENRWTSRAQVGKPYRATPAFKSVIKYVVLNPTWTVPPGILAKDMLPGVRRDPGYLKKRNIEVIDRNGRVVDQTSLDWSRYSGRNFPYQLRQAPGPDNALGRIKIIFPNPHFVYLHDTPSKSLFERTDRTFSSGCIRVEKPFELAALLLDDETTWSLEKIMQAVDSGQTRTVFLPTPVPVLLLYWTVRVMDDGTVIFKKDPYQRDKEVLAALEGDFKFRKRPIGDRPSL